MVTRSYEGSPELNALQRDEDRQERRRRTIKRFLMAHNEYPCYFIMQTFKDSFAGYNERAARARLLRLKKRLAEYGEFLVVWERGDETNRIHAHIIFAMRKPLCMQSLKAYMWDVGLHNSTPITKMRYVAISNYLANYVAKDLRYRYTASVSLRALPSLGLLKRSRSAGAGHLLSPPRSVTFQQVIGQGLTFVCWDSEQLQIPDLPPISPRKWKI